MIFVKLQAGKFLYCQEDGKTTCCFRNETCSDDYFMTHARSQKREAEAFLRNPTKYLEAYRQDNGFDSCHRIDGLNASVCAEDCEKFQRQYFSKECAINGGFLKCCIRWTTHF